MRAAAASLVTTAAPPSAAAARRTAPPLLLLLLLSCAAVLEWWGGRRRLLLLATTAGPSSSAGRQPHRGGDEDGRSSAASSEDEGERWGSWTVPAPLPELTGGNRPRDGGCEFPFVPVSDVVASDEGLEPSKIPRQIHLAWISPNREAQRERRRRRRAVDGGARCLHYLQAETIERWRRALPHHSIYLHDDDAVDRLLDQANWPEFPHLSGVLRCAHMRGALLVDIWRVLVLYKYGCVSDQRFSRHRSG